MDGANHSGVKETAMLNAIAAQRNQAANALAEQIGVNAELQAVLNARWNDVEVLRARLAELTKE